MTTTNGIRYEVRDHVAWVTIDRPERMNALDPAAQDELLRTWGRIEGDRSVRVVVLTGAGDRAFCAGDDLKAEGGKIDLDYWLDPRPDGFGHLPLRETLDVPVLARVNGVALGGGLELVVGCDLAVAADTAMLGFVEPRLGRLPLDGGIVALARQLPMKFAMEILLTGGRFSAADAVRMGLINEAVPAAELDGAVDRWLEALLACAPLSLRAIKQIVKRTEDLPRREARATRLPALIEVLTSDDVTEGTNAFKERRPPRWSGR
ncbi:MAG: enoyl-CoA hydratase-related protein [Chloroflexota bacterium]